MSLRSKMVGTLMGVFILYVFAAWLVLSLIHTPAFESLEHNNASNQLRRIHEFIATESDDVDLLVTDWAEWDDMMIKGMFLLPIEKLTAVLRGVDDKPSHEEGGGDMLSTMKRLTDSRGSMSQRNDEIGELISAFDDLSTSLQDATTHVWRIAHIDGLTGLANRRLIMDRLSRACVRNEHKHLFAVLFIDLDDFKNVNDQLGHEAGDQLLIEAASRIRSAVTNDMRVIGPEDDSISDMVARIGGDEFVVLLTAGKFPEHAGNVAAKIVNSVSSPYLIGKVECRIGACVGLALYPDDADDLDGLLANADAAMYEAKRAGKNTWRRYVSGLSRFPQKKSA